MALPRRGGGWGHAKISWWIQYCVQRPTQQGQLLRRMSDCTVAALFLYLLIFSSLLTQLVSSVLEPLHWHQLKVF